MNIRARTFSKRWKKKKNDKSAESNFNLHHQQQQRNQNITIHVNQKICLTFFSFIFGSIRICVFFAKVICTSERCVLYQNNATICTKSNEFEFWCSNWWKSANVSAILREREQHNGTAHRQHTIHRPTDRNVPAKKKGYISFVKSKAYTTYSVFRQRASERTERWYLRKRFSHSRSCRSLNEVFIVCDTFVSLRVPHNIISVSATHWDALLKTLLCYQTTSHIEI